MAIQQLFYESAVPVSFQRHKDVSVKVGDDYSFAKKVNSVPITAIEFARAAAEYPIVFAGTGEDAIPVAVLGVSASENLYVDEDGLWVGKYVPAFVRRYPFVFSLDNEGKTFTLNVDEHFDGVNKVGRGERLFDSDGAQTQYLKSVLSFLQGYQVRFERTKAYCRHLHELQLLQPMQAQFQLSTGEQRSLSGFMTVNRDKLKQLTDDQLGDLVRKDELECTFLHLASLRHFQGMLERFVPKQETIGADDMDGSKDDSTDDPRGQAEEEDGKSGRRKKPDRAGKKSGDPE